MQSMTRDQIMERVTQIVSDVLGLPDLKLTDQSTARDVQGWDSLTHVQIIIDVENEYGFQFSFSEAAQLENVGQFVDAIYAKTQAN
jgi:acyl carrier protein